MTKPIQVIVSKSYRSYCILASCSRTFGGYWIKRSPACVMSSSNGRSSGILESRLWTNGISHIQDKTSFSRYSTIWNRRQWHHQFKSPKSNQIHYWKKLFKSNHNPFLKCDSNRNQIIHQVIYYGGLTCNLTRNTHKCHTCNSICQIQQIWIDIWSEQDLARFLKEARFRICQIWNLVQDYSAVI